MHQVNRVQRGFTLIVFAMAVGIIYGDGAFYKKTLAEHSEEWRTCRSDDQCTEIHVGGMCGIILPVNKDYSDIAAEFASRRAGCLTEAMYGEGTVAKCLSGKCELWTPPESRALFGPEPPAAGECQEMAAIKAGMTRAEIEKRIHHEGSWMRYNNERFFSYTYKAGEKASGGSPHQPVCMVRIDFHPYGLPDTIDTHSFEFGQWLRANPYSPNPGDVAIRVSVPFIDRPCCNVFLSVPSTSQTNGD